MTQRPAERMSVALGAAGLGTRTEVVTATRKRERSLISPFALFGMIILAMFALCFTVTMRTHAEMNSAVTHYEQIRSDVESLRNTNASLETEVKRLHTDPRAIEGAARERLGMLRPNEIVVTVE